MKPLPLISAACIGLFVLANTSPAQPQHEAITQYKAFMAAARAGRIDEVMKLVEPVPKDAARLLEAAVKVHVASMALKDELTAQFGLPGPKDEDEFGQWMLAPAVMANLSADARNDRALIRSKDPQTREPIVVSVMVRRDGKWLVSAAILTDQWWDEQWWKDLEKGEPPSFKTPPADERKQFIEYAETTTKTIETVLARLKKKEFKTRAEVLKAVSDLTPKADGEIDIGDGCRKATPRSPLQ